MELVFNDYGVEVLKNENKYSLRYDAGEIVIEMREIYITIEEAIQIKAQKSSKELYDYLIKNLNKRMFV
ncbi:MAG TPA: hypothetical protein VIM70_23015 [Clostridium sp.]|uniref:hypothetical protein n=1 Tax=Clostridium sp. TaxID=1506 RepID=UPI002F91DE16